MQLHEFSDGNVAIEIDAISQDEQLARDSDGKPLLNRGAQNILRRMNL